jgi:CubicO group peptidase (beta-lactamase class C family)
MSNRILRTFTALVLLFTINAGAEQTTKLKPNIDRFMSKLMQEFDINSATSIAVVSDQEVIYQQSFGYADIENKKLATDDTLFYIASITKPLFALTVLQSLENSAYDTSLSLKKMFPEVVFAKEIQAEKITIKDLLTHTSGLDDKLLSTAVSTSGIYSKASKLLMLAKLFPSTNSKHGEFDYTNLGYNIVSIWYEKTFNKSWQDGIAQSVFKPLNMMYSTAYISEVKNNHWALAKPYSFFSSTPKKALYLTKHDNTMHAAGGVISTASDMAQFLKAQLNTKGSAAIHSDLIHSTQKPIASLDSKRGDFKRKNYAYGWYTGTYKNNLTYHHFGTFDGFRPHLSFMPNQQIGIVILNNEGMLNDKLTDLIADFIYSKLLAEKGAEARINAKIVKLKTMAFNYRKKMITKENNYTTAPWLLSTDKRQYTGTYHHSLAGDIDIVVSNKQFFLQWGNLHSLATPFRKKDQMRVKFRPTSGQYIQFEMLENKPTGLIYDGLTFIKTK